MILSMVRMLVAGAAGILLVGCGTTGPNRVAKFNGVDEYVRVKDAKALRLADGDFTLTAWIYINKFSNDSNSPVMAKRGAESREGWTWYVAGDAWPTLARKLIFHVSQGDNPFAVSATTFEAGKWYHIAMVYTAAAQVGQFYINGQADAQTPTTKLSPPNPATAVDLHIGRDSFFPRYFFDGMVDDVGVFNKALTPPEVKSLATRSLHGREPGLIALWNFDGRSPRDASSGGHHGVLMPAPAQP
jgi:hypothetical protein